MVILPDFVGIIFILHYLLVCSKCGLTPIGVFTPKKDLNLIIWPSQAFSYILWLISTLENIQPSLASNFFPDFKPRYNVTWQSQYAGKSQFTTNSLHLQIVLILGFPFKHWRILSKSIIHRDIIRGKYTDINHYLRYYCEKDGKNVPSPFFLKK